MSGEYDEIIELQYLKSVRKKHMPQRDRAAQFAPFAALTGYADVVEEAARVTQRRIELDDGEKEILNRRLNYLKVNPSNEVLVTYFEPDMKKDGGRYVEESLVISKIDEIKRRIITKEKREIPIDFILNIRGKCFDDYKCKVQ